MENNQIISNTEPPIVLSAQEEALLEAALAASEVSQSPESIDRGDIILPNSESILINESRSRFSGAVWYEAIQSKKIILAGLGGIGSYIAFLLGRLNPKQLCLYDPDTVETGNLSGQFYQMADIGKRKADATSQKLFQYSSYGHYLSFSEPFTQSTLGDKIMICGFDNMKARCVFFHTWKSMLKYHPKDECLFLDGRLAAEEYQVFAIQGNDERAIKEYELKWLFSEEEAEETPCSYKQTTFMANMIASVMVNIFVNFVANECNPIIKRDVPFMTSYSADTMYFKVEM